MKALFLTVLFTFGCFSVFAQWGDNYIKLSENITTEIKATEAFDRIDVIEDFKVFIKFSDRNEKVEIEANENLHDLIKVEVKGGILKITTDSYSTSSGGIGKRNGAKEHLVLKITTKSLKEIKGYEDVTFELEGNLRTDDLTISLNEDCILTGSVEVKNLELNLVEDCTVEIQGSAKSMNVNADEDCIINGYDLIVGDLKIKLNEDSKANLTVNGTIDLRADVDSDFNHRGEGAFTRKKLHEDSKAKAQAR